MATRLTPIESPTISDSLSQFELTIPVRYYIPEPHLECQELDAKTMQKEYEALSPALQKVFQEKEEFHCQFQTQFGLAATMEEIVQHQ